MRRWAFFAYGVACYLLFLATYAYMAGFVGDLAVPKTIDSGPPGRGPALLIDLGLLALFGVQHSVMARPAFKRLWTRLVPPPIERSTYVLLSCVALALLMGLWRPLDGVAWDVRDPAWRAALWALFALGWLLVPAVTLMLDHFDLFGTRQVWLYLHGWPYTARPFRTPLLYRWVRHPLYLGWALAFWAAPTMTLGHLLFAAVLTFYMALATLFEERDLAAFHGDAYREYQRRVPRFVPRFGVRRAAAPWQTLPSR